MWSHRNHRVLTRDAAHTNRLLQLTGKKWAYLAPEIRGSKGLDKSYICHLCYIALDKVVALHEGGRKHTVTEHNIEFYRILLAK